MILELIDGIIHLVGWCGIGITLMYITRCSGAWLDNATLNMLCVLTSVMVSTWYYSEFIYVAGIHGIVVFPLAYGYMFRPKPGPLAVLNCDPNVQRKCLICGDVKIGYPCPQCDNWTCTECCMSITIANIGPRRWSCCRFPKTTGSRAEVEYIETHCQCN
jgi:hypothetical protein